MMQVSSKARVPPEPEEGGDKSQDQKESRESQGDDSVWKQAVSGTSCAPAQTSKPPLCPSSFWVGLAGCMGVQPNSNRCCVPALPSSILTTCSAPSEPLPGTPLLRVPLGQGLPSKWCP